MFYTEVFFTNIKKSLKGFHSLVYLSLFNSFSDTVEKERPLWRLDKVQNTKMLLTIVSKRQPDVYVLDEFLDIDSYNSCMYSQKMIDYTKGSSLGFSLYAIPCKKVSGKIKGITDIECQKAWLYKKAKQCGFTVTSLLPTSSMSLCGKDNYIFHGVSYTGCLEIIDEDLLKQSLGNGVGEKKAWGFGLLKLNKN